jgi:NhaP-type Na+/H+ or K+/H+ antiporter
MVAVVGSLYAAHDVVSVAPGSQSPPLQARAVVFLLGGSVVLSALGAASWTTALRAAAAESLFYVGTVVLLGAAVVGLIRLLGALVVGAAAVLLAGTVTSLVTAFRRR